MQRAGRKPAGRGRRRLQIRYEGAGWRTPEYCRCSLGTAQRAFDKALVYAGEREQFGNRISDFQAIQLLADMATELQAARLMLYDAARALDDNDPECTKRSAMAKRFVTDTGFNVANEALQIHGGYGYLQDYEVERMVRTCGCIRFLKAPMKLCVSLSRAICLMRDGS